MPFSLMELLRRYRRDERGVVSVMAVGALVLSLAVAMIVIDAGAMLYARRDLQAATDAAALGAVRQLQSAEAAQAAAASIFDMNDYSTAGVTAVRGVYAADPSLAPEDRFTEESAIVEPNPVFNAIRVTKSSQAPTYFARVFGFDALTEISTVSTAAYMKTVSFSAGTRVADVNLGRQIFSGLLGIDVGLINYETLADVNVDALPFLDALATKVGAQVGSDTYGDLLNTQITMSDLNFALTALDNDDCSGDCAYARSVFANLTAGGTSVPVNSILDAPPFLDRTIGSVGSSLDSAQTFNILDLLSGAAIVMGEGRAVAFNLTGGLSPVVSVSGSAMVGSPAAHMAIGKVGDSVQTSQVSVTLTITVLPLLGLPTSIPLSIEVASGTAEISNIPCIRGGTMASLSSTTGIVSGLVSLGSTSHPDIPFTEAEYGEPKEVSSTLSLQSALGSVLPILVPIAPLEDFVNSLLSTLGVRLGSMDMTVHGVRCNAPVLVL